MKLRVIFFHCLVMFTYQNCFSEIRIVCSSALLNEGFEHRKNEYIKAIEIISNYGYPNPYFIEAVAKKGPTFLEQYTPHVFYSTQNNAALKNKGVNEGRTMLEGLKHFNFDPEDIVVKLTGRYHLISDSFFRLIEQHPDFDGFVKSDGSPNGIHTFCYALKAKYMIEILESLDYEKMEREMICVEWEIGRYIKKYIRERKIKVMYVNKLDIQGLVWGSPGYRPGTSKW